MSSQEFEKAHRKWLKDYEKTYWKLPDCAENADWAYEWCQASLKATSADRNKLDDANILLNEQVIKLEQKLAIAEKALEFCFRNGFLCGHDDPSWCDDRCRAILVAKQALKQIRGEE